MNDPWSKSFRVFAGIFALLATSSAGVGIGITDTDVKTIAEALTAITSAISALLAIYSKIREGLK